MRTNVSNKQSDSSVLFMSGVYLIIGGNLGNRMQNIRMCQQELQVYLGPIVSQSSLYETAAWGNTSSPSYLNQVLFFQTDKTPETVLAICLQIEQRMGRHRTTKWASREIDIDILFYDQEIIEQDHLKIPHPHAHQRRFVMTPMKELAPNFIHPSFQKTMETLWQECPDSLSVAIYNPKNNELPTGRKSSE